jgi:hypothetical protein
MGRQPRRGGICEQLAWHLAKAYSGSSRRHRGPQQRTWARFARYRTPLWHSMVLLIHVFVAAMVA